jgi:hypothetical protein
MMQQTETIIFQARLNLALTLLPTYNPPVQIRAMPVLFLSFAHACQVS